VTRIIGVAIGIPEPYSALLREWRARAGDPQATQVHPHVTLLPPTKVLAEELPVVEAHLEQVAGGLPPFDMHLRGTGTFRPVSEVVFIAVAAGIGQCEQLENSVRSGPLARTTTFPYHPHVTVAHDVPPERLDFAYEGLTHFHARFRVSGFTMFEHDPDGVWQPQRDFQLRGRR